MNRGSLEYLARKYGVFIVIGVTLFAFLLPLVLRAMHGAPITPGSASYMYLYRADILQAGSVMFEPYTILLAVMQLFGVPWLLPILLVGLFLFLVQILLWYRDQDLTFSIAALLLLIVSPSMSVLATAFAPQLLAMVFVTSAILLEKRWVLCSLFILLSVIAHPITGLCSALLLAGWLLSEQRHNEVLSVAIFSCAGVVFLKMQEITIAPAILRFDPHIFFELGYAGGISVFLLIIAVYGVIVGANRVVVLLATALFLASFFLPMLVPCAAIMIAVLAAHGIRHLFVTKWNLELLQQSMLILVGCIGIFLIITSIRDRVHEDPDADFSHFMITLRNQHYPGAVLTDPSYAPMVAYFSGRIPALVSEDSELLQRAFTSRSPEVVYSFLMETNTSFILITDDMQQKRFSRSDEGLLFLLHNTERFVEIQSTNTTTLWYFIRPK
jgi:hypothetical protein